MARSADWILALAAGVTLAGAIKTNSMLAAHSAPMFASWIVHGVGAVAALVLIFACAPMMRAPPANAELSASQAPLWAYLGGVPGAFTVAFAAIAVNSSLALSGTLALMLVGQILFGMASDHFGLFGTPKRRLVANDLLVALCVAAGSGVLILARA